MLVFEIDFMNETPATFETQRMHHKNAFRHPSASMQIRKPSLREQLFVRSSSADCNTTMLNTQHSTFVDMAGGKSPPR